MKRRTLQLLLTAIAIISVFVAAMFAASYVQEDAAVLALVEQYGYFGILVISIIAGVNIFVPIPAAVFVPIFTAAGYPLVSIIATIVIGTVIADSLSYLLGRVGKETVEQKYPETYRRLKCIDEQHHHLVLPIVFLYATFAPFPNEALMVPLALIGFKYRSLIIPFTLGTILFQTSLALGANSVFELLF